MWNRFSRSPRVGHGHKLRRRRIPVSSDGAALSPPWCAHHWRRMGRGDGSGHPNCDCNQQMPGGSQYKYYHQSTIHLPSSFLMPASIAWSGSLLVSLDLLRDTVFGGSSVTDSAEEDPSRLGWRGCRKLQENALVGFFYLGIVDLLEFIFTVM